MILSNKAALTLQELSQRLEALGGACRAGEGGRRGVTPLGIPPIDASLGGGLHAGAVHEWIGVGGAGAGAGADAERRWSPALGLLAHGARRASEARGAGWVVWVGDRVWPYPRVLAGACGASGETDGGLLTRSLFVRAQGAALRLWAADVALRCVGVACVVADAKGFDMGASRRLQLAAGAGGSLGLLARPPTEESSLSSASTRWRVERCAPDANGDGCAREARGLVARPRWIVELLRCKGVQPAPEAPRRWVVEWSRETGNVNLVAGVVRGPDHASEAGGEQRVRGGRRFSA